MLHLVDRLVPFELRELLHAPVIEHPIVQPILVDRREFVLERQVEQLDDFRVTLHDRPPLRLKADLSLSVR
jgi:hypothetical protein